MPHIDLIELPYFQGINIDDIVSLVDIMKPQDFPPGAIIFQEGDPPPPLYISTKGQVLLRKSSTDGLDRYLAELTSPTLFGEIEFFCQIPPVASVRATTPLFTFTLTRTQFDELLSQKHPAITMFICNIARVACHRLAIADGMLTHLNDQNLIKLRDSICAKMSLEQNWSQTTGVFKRPKLLKR